MQTTVPTTCDQASATAAVAPQPHRLYQCSTCKRSFTRADHLTRHVRAHTKVKPHVCPVCTKAFARIDLLKRHVANHDSEPASKRQKREVTRDARVVQACEACSSSHLRCEDEKPCSRCRKRNMPCQVPEPPATDATDIDLDTPEAEIVHATHNQADLSDVFDHSSPKSMNQNQLPSSSNGGQTNSWDHFQRPPSTIQVSTVDMSGTEVDHPDGPSNADTGLQFPPNVTSGTSAGDQYHTDHTATLLSFFDKDLSQFDQTPGHNPLLPDYFQSLPPQDHLFSGQQTPRGLTDLNLDMDVGLNDFDMGLLDQYNFQMHFVNDTPPTDAQGPEQQPLEGEGVPVRTEAFKQSVWRYEPRPDKDFGGMGQGDLAFEVSKQDIERRPPITQRRVNVEKLSSVGRDRLLALALSTCSPHNIKRIVSAFPSLDLLDGLIQCFLTAPALAAHDWLHLATFSPSKLSPELLACVVSAGAVTMPDTPLRKLGFALHEASRTSQGKLFEDNNTAIRDLQHLCSLFLQLKVGMWSGISRKMEIAESFLLPLVTMLRRGGRFRRTTWKEIAPPTHDGDPALEQRWHEWVHQESYLRLVYRVFELDRQSSMALLKPPLIGYSEMQLPIPSSNRLWLAKTPVAWKTAYLDTANVVTARPSALECLLELHYLAEHDHASTIHLHMLWGMVWEYRQMCGLSSRSRTKLNNSLILPSRHQELTQQLEDFRVSSPPLSRSLELRLELMLLHLNAPLDDVQLFAGIEGQDEARAAYPALREWTRTTSARQALCHAGQILRAAKGLPKALLSNYNAVAVYHAGLILWAYGFIGRSASTQSPPAETAKTIVLLNSDDGLSARRFVTLGRGTPSIRSVRSPNVTELSDGPGVMDELISLLRASHEAIEQCPPLVSNLIQLLEGLRSAMK